MIAVSGLAKMEGEVIEFDDELDESQTTTKYQLTGIVVHSGQASGGHYFSYILHKYDKLSWKFLRKILYVTILLLFLSIPTGTTRMGKTSGTSSTMAK